MIFLEMGDNLCFEMFYEAFRKHQIIKEVC